MLQMLHQLAMNIPGGVSQLNRFLLIADGHESRLNTSAINQARQLSFDVFLLPGNCTHFLQPWDQIFGVCGCAFCRSSAMHRHLAWKAAPPSNIRCKSGLPT